MLIDISGKTGAVCSSTWITAAITVRSTYKLKRITYKLLSLIVARRLNGFSLDLLDLACFRFFYLCIIFLVNWLEQDLYVECWWWQFRWRPWQLLDLDLKKVHTSPVLTSLPKILCIFIPSYLLRFMLNSCAKMLHKCYVNYICIIPHISHPSIYLFFFNICSYFWQISQSFHIL